VSTTRIGPLADAEATESLGGVLARAVGPGCRIYLHGELGAGKTTLVRGFLRALGHRGAVKSPTYTLMEAYGLERGPVYHLDLYRLADPEELEYLGLRDLEGPDVVLLVEWPERGGRLLPGADVDVAIDYAEDGRQVVLTARTAVGEQLLALAHLAGDPRTF
jgi:tRNA threonylcarbamoyladenosine biosynthesis protein TsaE